jgi:hypothetical protein
LAVFSPEAEEQELPEHELTMHSPFSKNSGTNARDEVWLILPGV